MLHVFGVEGPIAEEQLATCNHLAGVLRDGGFSYLVFVHDQEGALRDVGIEPSYKATLLYEDWLDGDTTSPVHEAGLTIVYPWSDDPGEPSKTLSIFPSLVFGTGAHPSSRRCLRLIGRVGHEISAESSWTALDLGCGTGILGLAALRLGASRVFGCDICEHAVDVARFNAERNNLQDRASYIVASAQELARPAELILANLPPAALDDLLLHPVLDHARWIIASGMLRSDHLRLLDQLPSGLQAVDTFVDGVWHTALIRGFRS